MNDTECRAVGEFLGAWIDTGAQRSVIGKPQATAYCNFMGAALRLKRLSNPRVYKFGEKRYKGLGSMYIRIPITESQFIFTAVEVADLNVSLLLGLDFLELYGMKVDVHRNLLTSETRGWELPIVRKQGHLYLEWPTNMLYTTEELWKMHHHFFHPKSDRLYAVMKRADPGKCSRQDLQELEDITAQCDVCQRLSRDPSRFRVSLPHKDIVSNRVLSIDIMFLDQRPVLHCVDKDSKFNSAAFLSGETVDKLWTTYLDIWSLPYVGHPEHMHADQGPQFRSRRWEGLCHMAGIELTLSGVELHNALGGGERYHAYLRQVYNKVRANFPNIGEEYALKIAVKAVNDTSGPKGLLPTLLVFGVMPRTVLAPSDLPKQKERTQAMESASIEMAKFVSQRRIDTALRSNIPAATSSDIAIGSEVLIYREPPVDKWVGPHKLRDSFGKHVFVESNGRLVKFSMDKIKLYRRDENTEGETWAVLSQLPQTSAVQGSEVPRPALSKEFDNLVAALGRDVGALKLAADEPIRNDEFCVWEVGDIFVVPYSHGWRAVSKATRVRTRKGIAGDHPVDDRNRGPGAACAVEKWHDSQQ